MASLGKRKGTHHHESQKRFCKTNQNCDVQGEHCSTITALNSSELETSDYYSFDENSLTDISSLEASSPLRCSTPSAVLIETAENSECDEFEGHGLGAAIDVTKDTPWEDRFPHQVVEVTPDKLHEKNDSNKVDGLLFQIESYSDFHGTIEAGITAPKIPISAGIATKFGRSSYHIKQVIGKSIRKRTITLRGKGGLSRFVKEIQQELKCKSNRNPVQYCRDILQSKCGGATHYISSITLGATECLIRECSGKKMSAKGEGLVGIQQVVSLKAGLERETRNSITTFIPSKVGRMKDDVVEQEGVIDYDYKPITGLVQDEHFTEAVRLYVNQEQLKKKGICGPYSIHSSDSNKYWKIVSAAGEKVIQLTNIGNCSSFFIEKDDEVGFKITTSEDGEPTEYPTNPYYVHMQREGGLRLKVDRLTKKDKKILFTLYDPIKSSDAIDLDETDWLPDPQSEMGKDPKECYLVPRSGLSTTKKLKRFIKDKVYCLHFTEQSKINLVSPGKSMKLSLIKMKN